MYSRHRNNAESPIGLRQGSRPSSGTNALHVNDVPNRNDIAKYESTLKRTASANDAYNLNLHQDFQGRKGHLRSRPFENHIRWVKGLISNIRLLVL